MEEIFALSPFVTPVSECSSMEGNKKPSPSKTLAEYPTKENEEGAKPKENKTKKRKEKETRCYRRHERISRRNGNEKEGGGANAEVFV